MAIPWIDYPRVIRWSPPEAIHGPVHLVDEAIAPILDQILSNLGFEVYFVSGENIVDHASLFDSLAITFSFPDFFGHNWEAFYDCFRDFCEERKSSLAILWSHADQTCNQAFKAFLESVAVFTELHSGITLSSGSSLQVVTFFLGPPEKGYVARSDGILSTL